MCIFIDNIKIISTKNLGHIKKIKAKLAIVFKMININLITFYLGLKVKKD